MTSDLEAGDTAIKALQSIVETIQNTLACWKKKETLTSGTLADNTLLNNCFNTFSIDKDEDDRLQRLTNEIQNIFNDCLPILPGNYQRYLCNLLFEYHYDFKEHKFKESLTMSILPAFLNDLQATRDSFDAFKAAWNGNVDIVKEFVTKYPSFNDEFGVWGTTLLYSAARNGHKDLVEYLVSEAGCSVNAQNEQHFERALGVDTITALDYDVNPRAGSTALHAACFYGRLPIVKYLVEHGADYYIKNQAEETPIMNIERHESVRNYFYSIMNIEYSNRKRKLPETPILDRNQPVIEDCVWEYKPFSDKHWHSFKADQSQELHKSLTLESSQPFQHEVYLHEDSTIYTVSTSELLRFEDDPEKNTELAWVRCRGSSILNFNCYALWQIFLTKHPKINVNSVPCLKVFDLPATDDSSFQLQLNTWYNCDAETNALLDDAMNYYRREMSTCISCISDDRVQINMATFSFSDKQGDISGFIRWIPKLVSKNDDNKNELKNIDNFQALKKSDVMLLTRDRLKAMQLKGHNSPGQDEAYMEDESGDDNELLGSSDQDIDLTIGEEESKIVSKRLPV
ncbi:unnamed protein product [Rotaria sp. Silwood2]|nr:unnamed protein product [Rotaria sp. Silwood2]CAF3503953.1 unnamed protein product [Rotaria sp. Silwood2]CAF4715022.1 unnamed protein product [Rotaria sp. Silwood2]